MRQGKDKKGCKKIRRERALTGRNVEEGTKSEEEKEDREWRRERKKRQREEKKGGGKHERNKGTPT